MCLSNFKHMAFYAFSHSTMQTLLVDGLMTLDIFNYFFLISLQKLSSILPKDSSLARVYALVSYHDCLLDSSKEIELIGRCF